jgi:hypothetical protein
MLERGSVAIILVARQSVKMLYNEYTFQERRQDHVWSG